VRVGQDNQSRGTAGRALFLYILCNYLEYNITLQRRAYVLCFWTLATAHYKMHRVFLKPTNHIGHIYVGAQCGAPCQQSVSVKRGGGTAATSLLVDNRETARRTHECKYCSNQYYLKRYHFGVIQRSSRSF
jgi:hypothetical protein